MRCNQRASLNIVLYWKVHWLSCSPVFLYLRILDNLFIWVFFIVLGYEANALVESCPVGLLMSIAFKSMEVFPVHIT